MTYLVFHSETSGATKSDVPNVSMKKCQTNTKLIIFLESTKC